MLSRSTRCVSSNICVNWLAIFRFGAIFFPGKWREHTLCCTKVWQLSITTRSQYLSQWTPSMTCSSKILTRCFRALTAATVMRSSVLFSSASVVIMFWLIRSVLFHLCGCGLWSIAGHALWCCPPQFSLFHLLFSYHFYIWSHVYVHGMTYSAL